MSHFSFDQVYSLRKDPQTHRYSLMILRGYDVTWGKCHEGSQVIRSKLTSELIVRILDGMELCSVVTEHIRRKLDLREDEPVWVMFNSFAVTLHIE